jgi:prepilin-type N-terminal cleavage/methylation domain-containing protein
VRSARGVTLVELLAACAVLGVLAALAVVPAYRAYQSSRAAADAALTFAQDVSLAERAAQNGGPFEGATLKFISSSPLVYECYHGRPSELDPRSSLGDLMVRRTFDDVRLADGPIGLPTPLLFASNGSVQFEESDGTWPDQHQTIAVTFAATGDPSRTSAVAVDLFTGAVSTP